jgi:type I restriction-modification system DNA methylase subunit
MVMGQIDLDVLKSYLWESANILRGSIDAADYKNYIFGLLFLKRLADVFDEGHFERLKGRAAVGHVRYATVGAGDDRDIQPFYESSRIAI